MRSEEVHGFEKHPLFNCVIERMLMRTDSLRTNIITDWNRSRPKERDRERCDCVHSSAAQ